MRNDYKLTLTAGLSLICCQSAGALSDSTDAVKEAARTASVVQSSMTRIHRAHSDADSARQMHKAARRKQSGQIVRGPLASGRAEPLNTSRAVFDCAPRQNAAQSFSGRVGSVMTLRCSGASWQVPGARSRARRGSLDSPICGVPSMPFRVSPAAGRLLQKKIFQDQLVLAGRKCSGANRARYLVVQVGFRPCFGLDELI